MSTAGAGQEVSPLTRRKEAPFPPVVAVSEVSSSGSTTPTLNSQTLEWDQTFLRITYLVNTMATPTPLARSPISSANPDPEGRGSRDLVRLTEAGGELSSLDNAVHKPAAVTPGHWHQFPKDKAQRKIAQIQTWRFEVACHGNDAFCGCRTAVPPVPSTSIVAAAPISPTPSTAPSSAIGTSLPTQHRPSTQPTCEDCTRPTAPLAPPSPEEPRGVKRAIIGIKDLVRKASGPMKKRADASPAPAQAGAAPHPPPFARTDMYKADPPRKGAPVGDDDGSGRRAPANMYDDDDDDGDDDDDDDSGAEVQPGALSSSGERKGLLDTNARLRRAQKLLARQKHPIRPGEAAVEGTRKGIPA